MVALILAIIIFLILSALFSGSEIAFISANRIRVELLKKEGSIRGRILSQFYDNPRDFLGTMLVGNNIALVIFTTLMTKLLEPFVKPLVGDGVFNLFLITLIITIVVLIFGEFLPKTLFRVFATKAISILAVPLKIFGFVLAIPTWMMTQLSTVMLRSFFKTDEEQFTQSFSRIDLDHFVQDNFEGDAEDEIDTNIFRNALKLKAIKVRDCMVPRNEIIAIDEVSEMQDIVDLFNECKLSRILTYSGDIDQVTGYIHHQQMMKQPKNVKAVLSKIPFVPEVMRIHNLMNKFIKEERNIACVVDEFGGTSGVITLEDILEEIFGEITDEHDQEEHIELAITDHEWLFSGRLEIDYLNEKYENIELPTGDYNTLSGYLVMTTASIPEKGAELILDGYKFILERVGSTKIETVRVIQLLDIH
ncbi:MAG: hemolysin family protein [Saprospiraceae bacterium]|nr:hemolysin family protein [Saprospiraceae bacterium]